MNRKRFALEVGVQLLLKLNVSDFSSYTFFVHENQNLPPENRKEFFDFPCNKLEKFIQIDLKFWEKYTLQLSASHNSDSFDIDHFFPSHRFGIGSSYLIYQSTL